MTGTFDDSRTQRSDGACAHVPCLVVLLECDRPLAGGARYSLEGIDGLTLGRGDARRLTRPRFEPGSPKAKTLDLRLPGRSLSGVHARLLRAGTSWAIEDMGSTNGTFVNGKRVARAILRDDDFWEVGHTILRVNHSVPALRGTPLDVDLEHADARVPLTLDPVLASDLDALATVALSDVPILVMGDSGTGKELLARWVHEQTGRRGDFVAVNCGALSPALVESQLFGHVKGAFSGAVRDEQGFVRAADGGTLFLDEIADLPHASQAALLRVLQEREVVPVGASRAIKVNLRLVTATHDKLADLVGSGGFRRDLFARISGFAIRLPLLRERRDDFGLITAALLAKMAGDRTSAKSLAPDAGRALLSYDWPLNIRELEHCLGTSIALARGGMVERSHLPPHVASALDAPARELPLSAGALNPRDEQLRLALLEQLSRHAGNVTDVAQAMGKARMQVHRWCRRFGLDPDLFRR